MFSKSDVNAVAVACGEQPDPTALFCNVMKKRIQFCILIGFILGSFVGGSVLGEALQPLSATQGVEKVIVPNVTGIPSDVALQILQMAGLAAKIQASSGRSLNVDKQDPGAGSLVAFGSMVVLEVGGATSVSPELETLSLPQENFRSDGAAGGSALLGQEGEVNVLRELYGPQSSDLQVQPMMAWYPQGFLTSDTRGGSSMPSLLGTRSAPEGRSNIFKAKPIQIFSGDDVPIIMAPTEGWQHGWVPSVSYAPVRQPAYSYYTAGSSSSSIQVVSGARGYSVSKSEGQLVSVPSVLRLFVSDAESAFKKWGLTIGRITQVETPQTRSGLIKQQFPEANSLVPKGTKVDLWVVK